MKLIRLFKRKVKIDKPDLSRRKFIRNAGALAALTVVATQAPSLLKYKDIKAQIRRGLIENQTFYLTETIVIDLPNVVFRNCKFTAVKEMEFMFDLKYTSCVLDNCSFDGNHLVHSAIRINVPQQIGTFK